MGNTASNPHSTKKKKAQEENKCLSRHTHLTIFNLLYLQSI